MNKLFQKGLRISMFVLITFFAVMLYGNLSLAGDQTMQANLNAVADQLTKWSKQSGTGKMTPEAQMKLSELLLETSQILKEISMNKGDKMIMEHNKKIKMMEKAWDPFDTADRM
jgi:hypothetical protein